ncbi:MAG: hypothetical protein NUV74_17970 [Candidatus Brocadiaceae bacterium]|nr:hypothetical protein [Candidatus Brocadiaceae bacterium]
MFLIDYFSFSPNVVYKDVYGHLELTKNRIKIEKCDDNNRNTVDKKTDETWARKVIERILICPISDVNDEHSQGKWSEYANNLKNFLNDNTTNNPGERTNYTMIKDPNDNDTKCYPKSILIYRNDSTPCWIRDKDHRGEDTEGMSAPDAGCDICRKCWWIDEFRKICYSREGVRGNPKL